MEDEPTYWYAVTTASMLPYKGIAIVESPNAEIYFCSTRSYSSCRLGQHLACHHSAGRIWKDAGSDSRARGHRIARGGPAGRVWKDSIATITGCDLSKSAVSAMPGSVAQTPMTCAALLTAAS